MIRTALAFVRKDFLMFLSYRFNLIIHTLFVFLLVGFFYLIGEFVGAGAMQLLQPYGGNYFAFLLIGVAFAHYMSISMHSFANNIREGQLTGTLEIILISPTRLSTFLISSSLWSYIHASIIIVFYLLFGTVLFDLDVGEADLVATAVIFVASILCFINVGVILASVVLVFKKGDAVFNALGGLGLIVSGLVFPPEALPPVMKQLSSFIPTTYSLHGLRMAVLKGHSLSSLQGDVIGLLAFGVCFFAMGIWAFPYALRKAKINGTLTQY